jgi:uncharacterized DUF497 family protein
MAELRVTWDSAKARANVAKHGVSFAEARFLLLGLSVRLRVLVVVHAYREAAGIIRIISARRATPREWQHYAQGDLR